MRLFLHWNKYANIAAMKPIDIINLYGTQTSAAKALGVSQSAISQWLKDDEVPFLRQHHIQVLTAGRLVAQPQSSQQDEEFNTQKGVGQISA